MNMDISKYTQRRARLKDRLREKGLPSLLVSHAANRFYLSGFELHDPQCNESSGMLYIPVDGDDFLLTDPRYEEAAAALWPREQTVIYRGNGRDKIREFLVRQSRRAAVESRAVSMDLAAYFGQELELVPCTGLVEDLRLFKDQDEIEALRRSCSLNHRVMEAAEGLLAPGMTEAEAAWEIERLFRDPATGGASELSFPSIVAVGPNAAKPHAIPGKDVIGENSPVLVDVGGRLEDYCSDQTRTFWVGDSPAEAFLRTMDLVREALDKAIRAMGPGMPCAQAYRVAWEYFAANKVEARFNHGLGHGVGLETHEAPSLAPHSDVVLAPGMVVTVEPGLYYPEWGGVRWEYMLLVTETGVEIL